MLTTEEFINRLVQELAFKKEAEAMSDRQLAHALIEEVWAHSQLWTYPAVLVDEAITRLRRHDTRRRWQERKERRAIKACK